MNVSKIALEQFLNDVFGRKGGKQRITKTRIMTKLGFGWWARYDVVIALYRTIRKDSVEHEL